MRKLSTGRAVKQAGFTLIELIIVIVIIGILAAVAVPKYADLTADAHKAVLYGVGGALASATATNYAAARGNMSHTASTDCSALLALVDVPSGVTASGTLNASGTPATCTISNGTESITVKAYGAP